MTAPISFAYLCPQRTQVDTRFQGVSHPFLPSANDEEPSSLSQSSARIIDRPGLGYGLFHAVAQPRKLYGIITTGVSFKGLNVDVGHLRHLRWHQSDDSAQWIAYNRMMGRVASALEHVTPEQFWVDKTKCSYFDETGQIQHPALIPCNEAVSAVKILAVAAREGQKIFSVTQANVGEIFQQLRHQSSVLDEVRGAVIAGKEVQIHAASISSSGWSGAGYVVTDPATGAGGYFIEGRGNGGFVNQEIVDRALVLNGMGALLTNHAQFVLNGMGLVVNSISYATLMMTSMLNCNLDAVVSIIAIAIIIALIVAIISRGGGLVVVSAAFFAAIFVTNSANAASKSDNCYVDCKYADKAILASTIPDPILGKSIPLKQSMAPSHGQRLIFVRVKTVQLFSSQ